jgi:formate hydrogenlyase subunit 4
MILELLQFILVLAIAPLVTGVIRKAKAEDEE